MAMSTELTFSVNGVVHKVPPDVPADTSLNIYLRHHAGVRDVKAMCHEGGCGACVVSVRKTHPVTKKTVYIAVNSCLVSVYSCHGWKITTVSGLGDRKSGYHSLQTTLAKFHGTQCGYCSPGMIMNMHSLLSENNYITMKEIENSFGGNICRCTGYRPIMDAFKSLASDADFVLVNKFQDIEDLDKLEICPKTGKHCTGVCSNHAPENFSVQIQDTTWYKVATVNDIFDVLRKHQSLPYMLVAGNTGHGVYRIRVPPKIYIDVNEVVQLKSYSLDENLVLGANMPLTDAMKHLLEVAGTDGYDYLVQIVKHVDLIANVPVRNVGTIAGNLSLKHQNPEFPSDIFLVLEAAGALLKVVDMAGVEVLLSPSQFLKSDLNNKVIVSVILSPMVGNYAFKTYKIMPRAQNAHAYVNAGFYVKFNNSTGNVESARIVFGGINPHFIHASKTEQFLTNVNIFDNSILQMALDKLNSELEPDWVLPDASPEYRKNLALSLFYKFILNMCPDNLKTGVTKSGGELLSRPLSSGQQTYETNKRMWPLQEPVNKLEGIVQCAGEAEYICDIPPQDKELFASFVLARKPLATISNVDAKDALAMDGVKAFFSAKDIPGKNTFTTRRMLGMPEDEEVFCAGRVLYYGQAVGVIVANAQHIADKAAKLVRIEYASNEDIKKPYIDVRDVLANEKEKISRAQLDASMEAKEKGANIAHIFIGSQDLGSQYHYSMETHAVVCVPTEDGMDVYPSTQWVDAVQMAISEVLNMPQHKINLYVRRLGGAYGVKISRNNQVSAACAVAAYLLNRPVRMVLNLEDTMDTIGKRYNCVNDYEVAVDERGAIQYLTNTFYQDFGNSRNEGVIGSTMAMFENCYDKSRFTLEGYSVKTEKPSNTWCRAPGSTEGIAMIENIMEHIAHVTGLDPIDVRKVNMRTENNLVQQIVDDFRRKTEYDSRKAAINEFNSANRWRKRGIAIVPMSYALDYFGKFQATVNIYHGDGTVAVTHAGIECGQGINTKVAQVCAHILGVPLAQVSVKPSSSIVTPNAFTTGGSVTSEACCFAAMEACKTLLERLKPVREELGPDTSWTDLIEAAHLKNIDLQASNSFKQGSSPPYEIAGLSCCEVEIDLLTGNLLILRVDILEDTGESMSPEIDVGQVEGAFVMGLGYWLSEQIIYDKETCELKTNRTWTYKPPGAKDIPIDFRVEFTRNSKNPLGVLRSKATGEPALCMSFVVICAIRHALVSVRTQANGGKPSEWFELGAPTTPEKIFINAKIDYKQFTL